MVPPRSWDGPGTWQIWGGRTAGWEENRGAISPLWQKPTHRHWVRALLGHKESHQGGPCNTTGVSEPKVGTVPFSSGDHTM